MAERRAPSAACLFSLLLAIGCGTPAQAVDPSEYEEQSVGSERSAAPTTDSAAGPPEARATANEASEGAGATDAVVAEAEPPPTPQAGASDSAEPASQPTEAADAEAGEAPPPTNEAQPETEAAPEAGSIAVEMVGFEHAGGQVLVALWRTGKGFPESARRAFGKKRTRIQNRRARVTFDAVPPGPFAVVVHHDEDKDFEMDTGVMGIPAEGYGFSRDAAGNFGPPSFEAARLWLKNGETKRVRIHLRY